MVRVIKFEVFLFSDASETDGKFCSRISIDLLLTFKT